LSSRAVVNYHYQGILVSQTIRNSLLSLIIEESDEKFSLSAFCCLHGKHIVIEIDQCNGQERLKNDHEKVCLGMVLKLFDRNFKFLKLFDRNFDSPLLLHPGYHRPVGWDRSVTGFWKNEKQFFLSRFRISINDNRERKSTIAAYMALEIL